MQISHPQGPWHLLNTQGSSETPDTRTRHVRRESNQSFRAACDLNVVGTRSGIRIPPPQTPPIQGLNVLSGYRCTCRIGCGILSPRRESLQSHLSKHGIHCKGAHGALYKEVTMQNFSTGRRPLYFIVNTSATREKVEEGSTAGKAKFGEGTDPGASEAVDAIAALSDGDDGARAQSREYADGGDSPRDPFEEGLEPSPEPSPCSSPANRPSPAELLGSSSKHQHSSALARSLPPGISDPELLSQPTLISSPISTGTLFAHTVFQTKQQDTGKIRICLASDIRAPHSDIITLNPSQVDVESYCGLLKSQWILDQEGRTKLVFHPAGGEQIPIFNRMMFHAAVTYQVDRKADMVTFSAAVRRDGWFRFW